jgi:hypothetical protein
MDRTEAFVHCYIWLGIGCYLYITDDRWGPYALAGSFLLLLYAATREVVTVEEEE